MTDVAVGKSAVVTSLKVKGEKRRRFLDLGLIPGTKITARRRSPSGDPKAFIIRGTNLALRSEETNLIEVEILN